MKCQNLVKVMVNAYGRKLIGSVPLPDGVERVSDVLNNQDQCILMVGAEPHLAGRSNGDQIIFKDSITYLESLDEPKPHTSSGHGGTFLPVVGELRGHDPQQIVAEIFLPYGLTLFDVLNEPRQFVSMRNVHFVNFLERYPFLAINKRQLILVRY